MKEPYKNEEFAAGTYAQVLIYDKGHGDADFDVVKNQLNELAAKFEVYEQGESEFDRINAQAGIKPVKVSKVTFELAEALQKYGKSSDGYYTLSLEDATSAVCMFFFLLSFFPCFHLYSWRLVTSRPVQSVSP